MHINSLNDSTLNDESLSGVERSERFFWIGIWSAILNFGLGQLFIIIADVLVDWENHPYETKRLNSALLKKIYFRLYVSFFTLVAETFTSEFDILKSQVSSNFIMTSILDYLTVSEFF